VADAAAQREASDTGGRDDAAGRRRSEPVGRMEEIAPGAAALGARDLRARIHAYASHPRQVDHDPAVVGAESRHAVGAAANRQIARVLPREVDGGHHIGRVGGPRDELRVAVDHPVVDLAGGRVVGIIARDHLTTVRGAHVGDAGLGHDSPFREALRGKRRLLRCCHPTTPPHLRGGGPGCADGVSSAPEPRIGRCLRSSPGCRGHRQRSPSSPKRRPTCSGAPCPATSACSTRGRASPVRRW
jgi:hypothetical protein